MKRFLAVLAALCFVLPLLIQARVVTEKEVFTVSEKLIALENRLPHLRLTQGQLYFKALEPLIYKGEMVGYVVQLEPQGFMLISALTEQAPQKFVCFSGNFDEVKDYPFLIYVMDQLLYDKVQLNYCLSQSLIQEYGRFPEAADVNQIFKNESNWISMLSSEQIAYDPSSALLTVGPLLSTAWGQSYPWNLYTPLLSGQHTLGGCSAVAQAQVMNYWFVPPQGKGSNSYYWKKGGTTLYASFEKIYFLDSYAPCDGTHHSASCQHGQASRVIADVGMSINMDYGLDASGADINVNNSLQTFFYYSPLIKTVLRSSYSSWDDWFNVFMAELDDWHVSWPHKWPYDRPWPALLGFHNLATNKYHAVVVDGYRTSPSNQVHVNMGWNGLDDGYYSMNNVLGYADVTYDHAVIGIRPVSQPPTVTITSPVNGQVVSGGQVWFSVDANDDFGVERVDFYIDGILIRSLDPWTYFCFYWDSMTVSNGSHKLKAIAYDDEGQASLPHEINLTVSNVVISLEAVRKIESAWLVKRHFGDLKFTATAPAGGNLRICRYEIHRKENNGTYQVIKEWTDYGSGLGLLVNQSYVDKYLDKNKTYTYIVKVIDSNMTCCGKSGEITI